MSATVARSFAFARPLATRSPLVAVRPAVRPVASFVTSSQRSYASGKMAGTFDHPVATVDQTITPKLPEHCTTLFEAKKAQKVSFEAIGKALGRDEVAVAAIFYGQSKASEEDVQKLSEVLGINHAKLTQEMYGWPDRGRTMEMPPKEPLIYRLFEIVQNYGYAYKAVMNEKFGDGIMSAISFSTNVKKETDQAGDWVVITLRGKWLPYKRF